MIGAVGKYMDFVILIICVVEAAETVVVAHMVEAAGAAEVVAAGRESMVRRQGQAAPFPFHHQ